jgi:hypothetical protein
MTMNKDLFLAILSMDSYNRGYGEGIQGLLAPELNPDGTPKTIIKIGNATITGDSVRILGPNAATAGFYALAYDMTGVSGFADGERVISYRGTDGILSGDLLYAWSLGGGLASASQGKLAIDFYNAVSGPNVYDAHVSTITTTGHSLGGGLAGFVATLTGGAAVGFDHMPFLAATYAAFMTAFRNYGDRCYYS